MSRRANPWLLLVLMTSAPSAQAQSEPALPQATQAPVETAPLDPTHEWSAFSPGKGFTIANTPYGSMNIGGYMLLRYLNQLPANQSFTDHLGREVEIDTRQDIQLHRIMLFLSGSLYAEKLRYEFMFWTVNSTVQVSIVGNLSYRFHEAFNLFGGVGGHPGSRSLTGPFPYFFSTDRQLAEDFFRPGFTGGIWASGRIFDSVNYKLMVGNNLSQIYINAAQLTRDFAESASIWFMPTTGEFGPRGGFGDYEMHDRVATRFGASFTHSREDRLTQLENETPDNTQIRLSDSLLFFQEGALAPGVTVQRADYDMLAADAGIKFRGLHLQSEYYLRWVTDFEADGALPIGKMFDHGFYVSLGYHVWPQRVELYGTTSQIFGRFGDSYEVGGGVNVWPFKTRDFRLNAVALYLHESAFGSLFGYYVGGQTGPTLSAAANLFF